MLRMNLLQNLYSIDDDDAESTGIDPDYVSLFEQARMILDHMWCSEDLMQIKNPQKSDWCALKEEMRLSWSAPLLCTMLLLAGMVICRIPFSAAQWVNRLFVPVCVRYGESVLILTYLLRMLGKRRQFATNLTKCAVWVSICHMNQERHLVRNSARIIFFVDPRTNVPVGILSNFLPDVRTDEQYVKTTSVL